MGKIEDVRGHFNIITACLLSEINDIMMGNKRHQDITCSKRAVVGYSSRFYWKSTFLFISVTFVCFINEDTSFQKIFSFFTFM